MWLLLPTSKSLDLIVMGQQGPPLPTSKSLDLIVMGLLGLPWSYVCQPKPLNLAGFADTGFER